MIRKHRGETGRFPGENTGASLEALTKVGERAGKTVLEAVGSAGSSGQCPSSKLGLGGKNWPPASTLIK